LRIWYAAHRHRCAHDLLHCGIRRPHRLQTIDYSAATYFPYLKPFLTALSATQEAYLLR
jgi:hypothetical protein